MRKTDAKVLIWALVAFCEITYMVVNNGMGFGMFWIAIAGIAAVESLD